MNSLFYEQWYKSRVNKIINIFGKSWFVNKQILELGCANGDIGIEFLKLGSSVVFSDSRIQNLESVGIKLSEYNFIPECALIDQDNDYNFNKKFDLVLNMGTLYLLKNWKEDLKRSLMHTNIMILESTVSPRKNQSFIIETQNYNYGSMYNRIFYRTQEEIENELLNLNCKYIRFDNEEMNTKKGWLGNKLHPGNRSIEMIYDWNYEKFEMNLYDNNTEQVHFKRFWLVLK